MFRVLFFGLGVFLLGFHAGLLMFAFALRDNPQLVEDIAQQYGHHAKRVRA